MRETIIEVRDLTKVFGEGDAKVEALRGVSLDIYRGDFLALVGPSGSGKSTLLHNLCGLDKPTSGSVRVSGRNLEEMSGKELSEFRRDHIGLIFQSYNLIPVLTVMENAEYILLLQGVHKRQREQRVEDFLQQVGLEDVEDRFPSQLSGGQQQRVAVARAMVSNPMIILADEPTANLDSHTGMNLLELMKKLNEEDNMTFVFSTHDEKIKKMAKRLVVLEDGKIVSDESR